MVYANYTSIKLGKNKAGSQTLLGSLRVQSLPPRHTTPHTAHQNIWLDLWCYYENQVGPQLSTQRVNNYQSSSIFMSFQICKVGCWGFFPHPQLYDGSLRPLGYSYKWWKKIWVAKMHDYSRLQIDWFLNIVSKAELSF